MQAGNRQGIQTYLYTSWFDLDVFGPIFADATTITHEVSEWMADPFVNNVVPDYVIPASGGFCQNLLEVGDPIEFLPNQELDVTVRGKLYHTQVETTLQWFSRQVPSSAFQGAYSYPDTTVLTSPSDPCPPQGSGQLSASWKITQGGASSSCAAVGGATVTIVSTPQGGGSGFVDLFDCTALSGTTSPLPAGSYSVSVQLWDSSNALLKAVTPPGPFTVVTGETTNLASVEFAF